MAVAPLDQPQSVPGTGDDRGGILTISGRGMSWSVTDPLLIRLVGYLCAQASAGSLPLAQLQSRGEITITWGTDTMQAAARVWALEAHRRRLLPAAGPPTEVGTLGSATRR